MKNRYHFESPEVIYCNEEIIEISERWIEILQENARLSPRKTCRLCLHKNKNSKLHQMIILHNKKVEVSVHKHLKSDEVLNVLSGAAKLLLYDDNGNISKTIKLSPSSCFLLKIPKNVFHTIIIESDWFLFQETIMGPFKLENTIYASWASK